MEYYKPKQQSGNYSRIKCPKSGLFYDPVRYDDCYKCNLEDMKSKRITISKVYSYMKNKGFLYDSTKERFYVPYPDQDNHLFPMYFVPAREIFRANDNGQLPVKMHEIRENMRDQGIEL